MNFWQKLKKPILCLAPMADVTDAAFRFLISKYSNLPHVTYTEFVSADGLVLAPKKGREKLLKNLEYSEIERPIVAQLFTSKPEIMEKAAKLVMELGFDGLDINMGCPDRSVEKQGAGAALMKNPKLAREIIAAARSGLSNSQGQTLIPVSVKTRLGYNKDELETWLPELLAEKPAAIIIHARTRKEMSKAPARWGRVKNAVDLRDKIQDLRIEKTLIIGNGDLKNIDDALNKCKETGADGAMLGRAVFGRPWLFSNSSRYENEKKIIEILIEHIKLFDEKFNGLKSFSVMKKHFKAYLAGDKELRKKMMETGSAQEALEVLYSL